MRALRITFKCTRSKAPCVGFEISSFCVCSCAAVAKAERLEARLGRSKEQPFTKPFTLPQYLNRPITTTLSRRRSSRSQQGLHGQMQQQQWQNATAAAAAGRGEDRGRFSTGVRILAVMRVRTGTVSQTGLADIYRMFQVPASLQFSRTHLDAPYLF